MSKVSHLTKYYGNILTWLSRFGVNLNQRSIRHTWLFWQSTFAYLKKLCEDFGLTWMAFHSMKQVIPCEKDFRRRIRKHLERSKTSHKSKKVVNMWSIELRWTYNPCETMYGLVRYSFYGHDSKRISHVYSWWSFHVLENRRSTSKHLQAELVWKVHVGARY